MGIVGISFGSPTSGQGFDVSSTVSQMVTNLQSIETPWKNQLSLLESQDSAVSSIGSDISTLSNALQSLTDFEGVLSGKQGSSSDNSVLELSSASSNAVAGTHTVVVTSLAETSSFVSTTLPTASAGDTLSGQLTVTVNGNTQTIDAGGDTLSTLASAINGGNYGFSANVITDSSGSRLSLVSGTSGVAGDLSVSSTVEDGTSSTAISFTQSQPGADAQLTVDGASFSSASNTVTTAIQGVTFQLLSAAPSETVQVEITNDNSAVETAVSTFVSAYNTVLQDLNQQEGDDASGNPEPLYGNSLTATLQEDIEQALDFTQTSGAITSITQLGISVNDDGTLSLDTDTLNSELNSNYSDVVNFFEPSGSFTSFGGNLSTVISNIGNNAPSGLVYEFLQQNSTEESTLNAEISNENVSISAQQSQLTTELNLANYTLTEIPQQLDNINEIYSAITGYNENGNN
ncbi:flagellar filament capping protein FliD [Paracidobacterium acidisoli]|uniref:Flagellar hook-associated protein 2 n=1 Tax=Paracidobacterium acidisoli TaxID=2303751 RepID=A0A372IVT7_9BACT|nr:flagellar filament capping protein FliD [Paracidobacterium acidisoli]MBT9329960.1 flagellar filament capping protein FliD [Paracidobacterium acidisoli]